MDHEVVNKIDIRLFVGYLMNAELNMNLIQSPIWKLTTIMPDRELRELVIVHYRGKDYLGTYLLEDMTLLEELRPVEIRVKERLAGYCPGIALDHFKICVFAQMFVA